MNQQLLNKTLESIQRGENDWEWKLEYNLEKMTSDIMMNLKEKYKITA